MLGSSGVVTSGLISSLIWATSIVTLLVTLLITAHGPPSRKGTWGKGTWGNIDGLALRTN